MHPGVNGIIGLWQSKFYGAGAQFWIVFRGLHYHLVPMVVVQKAFLVLKRTLRGYNEPNLIYVGKLHHMVGDDQMADMNGVEGAKIKSHLFHRLPIFLLPGPYKLGHKLVGFLQSHVQVVIFDDLIKLGRCGQFHGSLGNAHIDFIIAFRAAFF